MSMRLASIQRVQDGFTLSELLIALVILGVIATFTIPKVLTSQQNARFNSIGKEAIGAIAQAYELQSAQGGITANTATTDILQYLNYVKRDTSSLVDLITGSGSADCSNSTQRCYVLHNGAMLFTYIPTRTFGDTSTTSAMAFYIDPDGTYSGTTNGSGKALLFFLYIDGAIRNRNDARAPTCDSTSCGWPGPTTGKDPDWFSWN